MRSDKVKTEGKKFEDNASLCCLPADDQIRSSVEKKEGAVSRSKPYTVPVIVSFPSLLLPEHAPHLSWESAHLF